ncbi:RNase H family protein [Micrococcus lylae]|uniref:RNase H family protein n=1 Tax=Micrococcus lylae TaxID=1273 RepID=UPI003EB83207
MPTAGTAIVERIRRLMTGLQVDLGWVRGHSGDVHNEIADRLTVMARRNAEFEVPEKQAHAMLTDLRYEAAEQLISYSLEA